MSTEPTLGRNRLVVPLVAVALLGTIVAAFAVTRGNDGEVPPAAPTASTPPPKAESVTVKLKGSGDAPPAIAVGDATVARSATGVGLAADIPKIDLKDFDTITFTVEQDGGDTLWNLVTVRDPRGAFISPELVRVKNGDEQQFACPGAAVRIKATRLTMTMPLPCLDDSEKPLKARLELKDRDGGIETTSTSKKLSAQ